MSFSSSTTNYGLPQWESTDKPSYLTDQNTAYETIDETMKEISDVADAASSTATSAESTATSAQSTADTASTNASNALANEADVYSATSTYEVGDYALYSGLLYQCNTEITVAEAFDGTKWDIVTLSDEIKEHTESIGDTDISEIGDGTLTGGISQLNSDLSELSSNLSNLYKLDFANKVAISSASGGTYTPTKDGIISLRSAWSGVQTISLIYDGIYLFENNSADSFVSGNAVVNSGITYTYTCNDGYFIPFE